MVTYPMLEQIMALLVERVYGAAVGAKYQYGKLPERLLVQVARSVFELSLGFTGRGEFQEGYLRGRANKDAYLLYYLPSNILKSTALLNELVAGNALPDRQRVRILDVGSGPGSATLGLLTHPDLDSRYLEITAVDMASTALEEFVWIVGRVLRGRPYSLRTSVAHLEKWSGAEGEFDLIVASNLLNELYREESLEAKVSWLGERILPALAVDGSLLLIEPALKSATMDLMKVRDLLLKRYEVNIYSPCPEQGICPMLANTDRNWCHAEIGWRRPELVAQIDKMVGNRKETLKFSYLIVRKDGQNLAKLLSSDPLWRVVSDQHKEKGRKLVYACGMGRYSSLVKLKRDASPVNRDFDNLSRADYLSFPLVEEREEIRITADCALRSFGSHL